MYPTISSLHSPTVQNRTSTTYILELATLHLNLYMSHYTQIVRYKVTLWNILSKIVKTIALPGLPGGPGGPLSPGGPVIPVPMQLKHVSP